jgi:hypothetical protein
LPVHGAHDCHVDSTQLCVGAGVGVHVGLHRHANVKDLIDPCGMVWCGTHLGVGLGGCVGVGVDAASGARVGLSVVVNVG